MLIFRRIFDYERYAWFWRVEEKWLAPFISWIFENRWTCTWSVFLILDFRLAYHASPVHETPRAFLSQGRSAVLTFKTITAFMQEMDSTTESAKWKKNLALEFCKATINKKESIKKKSPSCFLFVHIYMHAILELSHCIDAITCVISSFPPPDIRLTSIRVDSTT